MMRIQYQAEKSLESLEATLHEVASKETIKSICLLGCDANEWSKEQLDPILKKQSLPIIGGIFPQVIHCSKNYETGFVVAGLNETLQPVLIEGLSDDSADFESVLDAAIPESIEFDSMLVFVDGLASRIGSFVDALFATFGSEVDYIGGGAGSLSFESKPCVLTNQGVFSNAAVVGLIDKSVAVQVGHGWKPFNKTHIVNKVEKNVVQEIDYKNALEVYEAIIGKHLKVGDKLTQENFFENAQSFPLGIIRTDGHYIVRDPIAINDKGELICVGELSNGDNVDILTAEPVDLIESVGVIAQKAATYSPNQFEQSPVLLIDCISRALFLKEDFTLELDKAVGAFDDDSILFGALVLGEIANSGTGYLEFYNKTAVLARL